jgi:hypothetical protein
MKGKITLMLGIGMLMLLDLADATNTIRPVIKPKLATANIKFVHVLKDKKGNLLGNVYIEDFKNDVFNNLLITKIKSKKTDTLYFINKWLFINPKGVDLDYPKENFNGFKIELLKDDSIQLFGLGRNSSGASDPITIAWDYKKKLFKIQYSE